jgi:flagellin
VSTVINTNMASLFAQNSLANAQNNLATSVQRLSSGLRINSAKDDAAGLAISQSMQGQINGTNQSIRNLSNATNLLQTADTSLATIQDMLLRLKQLAVQGYDGSLSATQKLDIVNEMKDLNTEINATAMRTSFNGINLLSSGASVDSTNSDLYAGQQLQMIGSTMGITNGVATSVGVGLDATGNISDGTTDGSEFNMSITDAFKQRMAGLTYTLSSAGSAFTITGTLDGQAVSQTVNLQTVVGTSSASERHTQTLDFSTFGTTIDLTTVTTTTGTVTGTSLASGLAAKVTMALGGNTGTISDVKLSGASSGSYTLAATSSVSNVLTMSGTINGMATTQSLALSSVAANTTTTFSFDSFGVSFDISAYGTTLSGINLANTLVTLNEGTQAASGTLVISTGQNSELQFQSGATSDAFITIDTVNVMTGSSGNTAGASREMKAVGTAITDTATSNLGGLNASNDISTWQAAFKAAEAAVTTALDYISTQRAVYGSQMNRLSYVSTNLTSQSTNLQNSRSAIIDTDFAAETAKLTKGQIMQQAATAMLAQANQMPNVVLSLLK